MRLALDSGHFMIAVEGLCGEAFGNRSFYQHVIGSEAALSSETVGHVEDARLH